MTGLLAVAVAVGLALWVVFSPPPPAIESTSIEAGSEQRDLNAVGGASGPQYEGGRERTSPAQMDSLTMQVTVKNRSGAAVVGAWVAARPYGMSSPREQFWPSNPTDASLLSSGRTNDLGVATLQNIPRSGRFEVGAWGEGAALTTREVLLHPSSSKKVVELELTTERSRQVVVAVTSTSGEPVAGAEVRLRVGDPVREFTGSQTGFWGTWDSIPNADGSFPGYTQKAITDSNGQLRFHSVPLGVGEVRWRAQGYINHGRLDLAAYATQVSIRADPGMSIRGQVFTADGDPAAGAHITVKSSNTKPKYDSIITAERDRYFQLDENYQPSWTAKFKVSGLQHDAWHRPEVHYLGVWYRGPWQYGDPGFLKIKLPEVLYLSGRIDPKVNPDSDNFVFFQPVDVHPDQRLFHNSDLDYVLANADGTFRIPVDPGEYLFGFEVFVDEVDDEEIIDSYSTKVAVDGDVDLGTLSIPIQGWKVEREGG